MAKGPNVEVPYGGEIGPVPGAMFDAPSISDPLASETARAVQSCLQSGYWQRILAEIRRDMSDY